MNNGSKKLLIGGVIVVLLGGYALWASTRSTTPAPAGTTAATTADQTGGQTSVPSGTTNPNTIGQDGGVGDSSTPGDSTPSTQYKDGTYTGIVGSAAPYGQVQVKVTISGGKMTAISLLKKPEGPGETNEVTARAFPILIQEAISVQNESVHTVSGATQDSDGFRQSLSSALAQAQS
ncbi:MAG TPA: FMN-binding protein [Candidatus Paceibacterota bacterium]|nr:FMN-binding protein [Candidatus Paceibacterota bacterium]